MFILDHQSLDILDVNSEVLEKYGFPRKKLLQMNIADLGDKHKRRSLIKSLKQEDTSSDKVWEHTNSEGERFYVQFTSHIFNFDGRPVRLAIAHDVTSLIAREETNRARFPQVQSYLSTSPLGNIKFDHAFVVKNWSEKAEDIFGWSEDEVVGREDFFEEFVHEEELDETYRRFERAVSNQLSGFTIVGRNYTKSGRLIHCEWYVSLLYDKEGEIVSIKTLVDDISDRKQSENLFRVLLEESLVGVYLIQDGVFKYINPRFARIFHYPKEEIENKLGPMDLTHPEDKEIVRENIGKRMRGETKSIEYDFRCLTRDGQTIYVNVYGTGITYEGNPAVVGTLVDITERKLTMKQHQTSVASYEDLFDSISDAIYIQKANGKILQVNQGAVDMYGYDREELIGRTPELLSAPGKVDHGKSMEYVERALDGKPQQFEWWGKKKNGEVFPEEIVLNPGTYFGEDVIIGIVRDISERYEAQEEIKKNEELFRQLFQNSHIGILMMDSRQEIRIANKAFEDIFGYSTEEIKGMNIDKLIVPENRKEEAKKLSKKIFQGEASDLTGKRRRKDGSLVDVIVYGVPVIVDGKTIAIFGMYVDISERKEAEEQIRKSLKEKEVLLAEIHHRVKNNLAVITGLLELQTYNTDSQDAQRVLRESQMRVNSIALIHEKLYQSEDLSQISIDVYVRELTDIIVSSMRGGNRDIELSIEADPVHLTVNQAIPCGLILNELVTNSFKHAFSEQEKGRIEIGIHREENVFHLEVTDTGKGLPDDLDFENPTSLGLTLIRTLCKQLEGDCTFGNEEGFVFRMSFELE